MSDIFGRINPPVADPNFTNPTVALGTVIAKGVNLIVLVAGFIMLVFLFWGALDWILSQGDKEAIIKAQMKITHALVGMVVTVAMLTAFGVITGDVLGIIKRKNGVWEFNIPSIGSCKNIGVTCNNDIECCSGKCNTSTNTCAPFY